VQLNLFDLNLLRALDSLLREKNVTRAAEQLHVTQQAMSGSLKRLREHFSDEILIRVGQHLEPTPLGAALIAPVREVMLQIDLALKTTPSFDPASAERRFRIAMSDYATVTILPHFMAYLSHRAPGIVCEIQLIDDAVFRDLEDGKLDFCLLPSNWRLYQATKPSGVHSLNLFSDDFVCVIDKHNEAVGETIDIAGYIALRHNMVRLGGNVRSLVEQAWNAYGLVPSIAATTTSFASLIFMIPGSTLIATAQRRLAVMCARLLPIRLLECPIQVELLQEDLSWHIRNQSDPAHVYVRQAFQAAAAALGEDKQGL
jgi:LysR family nod box-dependent transcriptional activator